MKTSTRTELLEHSKAKVELLKTYLSTFLNIISRVSFYKKIHIYDLFCGEGIYSDNSEGSPILIMKTIKNHYNYNGNTCPNIDVWINDNGQSEIEITLKKVERVKRVLNKIYTPPNVSKSFSDKDYNKILPLVQRNITNNKKHKHLVFIDPHGYKEIHLDKIKNLLNYNNTEVILFLPLFDM